MKSLINDSVSLVRHLESRVPPMEQDQIKETQQQLLNYIMSREKPREFQSENEENQFKQRIGNKLNDLAKKKIYNWKPMNYNAYNSLVYLMGRFAPEYAVLVKIFSEIKQRDPDFKPKSLFDFGSGVGTGTWYNFQYTRKIFF